MKGVDERLEARGKTEDIHFFICWGLHNTQNYFQKCFFQKHQFTSFWKKGWIWAFLTTFVFAEKLIQISFLPPKSPSWLPRSQSKQALSLIRLGIKANARYMVMDALGGFVHHLARKIIYGILQSTRVLICVHRQWFLKIIPNWIPTWFLNIYSLWSKRNLASMYLFW